MPSRDKPQKSVGPAMLGVVVRTIVPPARCNRNRKTTGNGRANPMPVSLPAQGQVQRDGCVCTISRNPNKARGREPKE